VALPAMCQFTPGDLNAERSLRDKAIWEFTVTDRKKPTAANTKIFYHVLKNYLL